MLLHVVRNDDLGIPFVPLVKNGSSIHFIVVQLHQRNVDVLRADIVDGADHIGGNYAAALNFETNLPNLLPDDTNIDISLFLDFGNVWGVDYDSSINESNKIRSTTGAMASWMSPIGPMTFTLSQNISKANTDETESFNFNLGTTF